MLRSFSPIDIAPARWFESLKSQYENTLRFVPLCSLIAAGIFPATSVHAQAAAGQYARFQVFHPGGAYGAWDYMTVDAANKLLFVPCVTHTQVLNENTGAAVADIRGQEAQSRQWPLAPLAWPGIYLDGDDASVSVFDLRTFATGAGQDQGRGRRRRDHLRSREQQGAARVRRFQSQRFPSRPT